MSSLFFKTGVPQYKNLPLGVFSWRAWSVLIHGARLTEPAQISLAREATKCELRKILLYFCVHSDGGRREAPCYLGHSASACAALLQGDIIVVIRAARVAPTTR